MPVVDLYRDPDADRLLALTAALRDTITRLRALIPAAADAQWQTPPVPKPREDTTQRAKGGHSDPTPAITLNERRLALRAHVQRAEALTVWADAELSRTTQAIETALTAWEAA